MKKQQVNAGVLTTDEALDLIIRLEVPFRLIGWIMLETGVRYVELQQVLVRDVPTGRARLQVGERMVRVSAGLANALERYLRDVFRPAFELRKRGTGGASFAAQRIFPAWLLDGCEDEPMNAPMPTDDYVDALQAAARIAGVQGFVNSNTLRLVAAREWLRQGMSITELHERLGHEDMMTTLLLAQSLRHGGLTFANAA